MKQEEYFDVLLELFEKHIEAQSVTEEDEIKEKILAITWEPFHEIQKIREN